MLATLKHIITIGVMLLGAACALAATPTGGPEFDRYRVILSRKPFGEITPAETATSAPTESLTKDLEMRAIIDEDNTLRVGFLDKKNNKLFYLGIGEQNEGYELVSVNYDNEEAVLRKGTVTSIFALKPNKTPATPGAAETALRLPSASGVPTPGFAPLSPPSTAPAQGLTPVPLSGSKKPFFSDLKKRKFSPFKPLGTNVPVPFQSQSLEAFMKANPNVVQGFPGQVKPFEPVNKTDGKGDTIDSFLRANPDAARQFSPLRPLDTNAAKTETKGSAMEGFFMQNQDQAQPPQAPAFFPVPAPEDSGDASGE